MESFAIWAENGHITFHLTQVHGYPKETCPFGGYDVYGQVEIKCGSYFVKGELAFTTGEIYRLYSQLKEMQKTLQGKIKYDSYEYQLSFIISIDSIGNFTIAGEYKENLFNNTQLHFDLKGDPSYLFHCLPEMKTIVSKYGSYEGKVIMFK